MSSTDPAALNPAAVPPLRRPLASDVLVSAAAVVAAAALAWAWLVRSAGTMDGHAMGAMAVDPWAWSYLLPAFVMWALMMVAMMLPSALPMILLRTRIDRTSDPVRRQLNGLAFVAAYVLVWSCFSLLAVLAQALLVDAGLISAMSLALGTPVLAAGLLLMGAAWQLSPGKSACLEQCRSPIHFVMRYWRPGIAGSLRLGIVHGLYCLGCCWALMLLLFVGGVMNLAWIALLAAAVLIEKIAPPRWRISLWLAAGLAVGAAAIALPLT